VIIAVLTPLAVLASWHAADGDAWLAQPPRHSARAYYALVLMLVLEAMLIGSARCLTAAWP
jgi:hypothetical protein